MTFLETESGQIIETESGIPILVAAATSNDDIQLFDSSVNLLQALLWQYNDATNLQGLLNAKNMWYLENQTNFWNSWYQDVFNLATANQFGLIVWSIILGLPLYVNTPPVSGSPIFGFSGSTTGAVNFDSGILGDINGSSELLPINTQRIALQLRYFQLTSSGTVPEINRMLKYVFASYGSAYLLDGHDMTQSYIFNFPLTWDLTYLFTNYDLLPRPAGVQSNFQDATLVYFGFNGSGGVNFDNGVLGG